MNESTWNPQPGDRVLIRNAGEYGWLEGTALEAKYWGSTHHGLAQVGHYPKGQKFTVLRSDLSPVWLQGWERPEGFKARRSADKSVGWHGWGVPFDDTQGYQGSWAGTCPTCRQPLGLAEAIKEADARKALTDTDGSSVERYTGPETEETRRLTREDYSDIERAKSEATIAEWLVEQLELLDPTLAESYRARTRKEGTE